MSYTKVKPEYYISALHSFRKGNLKLYTKISSESFGEITKVADVKRYAYRLYVKDYINKEVNKMTELPLTLPEWHGQGFAPKALVMTSDNYKAMYEALNDVLNMQKKHCSNGMKTHAELAKLAEKMELILTKARGK